MAHAIVKRKNGEETRYELAVSDPRVTGLNVVGGEPTREDHPAGLVRAITVVLEHGDGFELVPDEAET